MILSKFWVVYLYKSNKACTAILLVNISTILCNVLVFEIKSLMQCCSNSIYMYLVQYCTEALIYLLSYMIYSSTVDLSDLTRIQKTSSGTAREATKCALNKILIPKVGRVVLHGRQHNVPVYSVTPVQDFQTRIIIG